MDEKKLLETLGQFSFDKNFTTKNVLQQPFLFSESGPDNASHTFLSPLGEQKIHVESSVSGSLNPYHPQNITNEVFHSPEAMQLKFKNSS